MFQSFDLQKINFSSILQYFLTVKIENLLLLVTGLMSISTWFVIYRNTKLNQFKMIFITSEESDILAWAAIILLLDGVLNCLTAFSRSTKYKLQFNLFVSMVVILLILNFIIALLISEYKNQVFEGMEPSMLKQLEVSIISKQKFGVNFKLSDTWDDLQIKMSCCGVNSYKDYPNIANVKFIDIEQVLPISCCAMIKKQNMVMVPENLMQCIVDARRGVATSAFLNTQGCHINLIHWFAAKLNKIFTMVFTTIIFQTVNVFYISWLGYQKMSLRKRIL